MKRIMILLTMVVFQTVGAAAVTFNGAVTYQTIEGFGANINHRSWTNDDLKRVASVSVRSRQKLGARGWANHPPQAAARVCR
jgi:O-glycosyl hydrolase